MALSSTDSDTRIIERNNGDAGLPGRDIVQLDVGPEGKEVFMKGCKVVFPPGCFNKITKVVLSLKKSLNRPKYIPVTPEFECSFFEKSSKPICAQLNTFFALKNNGLHIYNFGDELEGWKFYEISKEILIDVEFYFRIKKSYYIEVEQKNNVSFITNGSIYADKSGKFSAVLSYGSHELSNPLNHEQQILELLPVQTQLDDTVEIAITQDFGKTSKPSYGLKIDDNFLRERKEIHEFYLHADKPTRSFYSLRYDVKNGNCTYIHPFQYFWSNPGTEPAQEETTRKFSDIAGYRDLTGRLLSNSTYITKTRLGGSVYLGVLCHCKELEPVAVKIFSKLEKKANLMNVTKIRGNHIVNYRMDGIKDGKIFIAMEFCSCSMKFLPIASIPEAHLPNFYKAVMLHIVIGTKFIHDNNFPHRKLNEKMIFLSLDKKYIKIGIFGEASDSNDKLKKEDIKSICEIFRKSYQRHFEKGDYSIVAGHFFGRQFSSVEDIMRHPFFWDDAMKQTFFHDVNYVLNNSTHSSLCELRLHFKTIRQIRNDIEHPSKIPKNAPSDLWDKYHRKVPNLCFYASEAMKNFIEESGEELLIERVRRYVSLPHADPLKW